MEIIRIYAIFATGRARLMLRALMQKGLVIMESFVLGLLQRR